MAEKSPLIIANIIGQNGTDAPILLPNDMATQCRNVMLMAQGVGTKRNGSTAVGVTFSSGGPFTAPIVSLFRHIPAATETSSELWAIDSASPAQLARMTGAATWVEVAVGDAILNGRYANACSFNGKMFLAYDSAVDRLHVWDGTSLRRVGLATPGTVTAADKGSGSYAATLRYYKVAWTTQASGVTVRRSEPSAAASITPSGSGIGVTVTRPTVAGESETHWETYGSADGTTYYLLGTRPLALSLTKFEDYGGTVAGTVKATTASAHSLETYETITISGTTSYNGTFEIARLSATEFYFTDTWVADDATGTLTCSTYHDDDAPGSYSGTVIPLAGWNTVPSSVKYVVTNGNRLLMAGSRESGGKNNRVWFTPVLGASDVGDDERIPNTTSQKNWIDLDENDGGYITGMVGQFQGATLVFKYRQLWKLVPTGSDTSPYRAIRLSGVVGAVSQKSIVEGEDESGNPAIYFLSPLGPHRYGANGLESLSYDISGLWNTGMQSTTFLATQDTAHGVWYPYRRQVVWFYRLVGDHPSDQCVVLNVTSLQRGQTGMRGGWAVYTFPGNQISASVMHNEIVGTSNGGMLRPYIYNYTSASATAALLRLDDSSATSDNSTAFQAYVTTKAYAPAGFWRNVSTFSPHVMGTGGNGTVTLTITGGLGDTATGTVNFNSTTSVLRQAEALSTAGDGWFTVTVGDAAAQALNWSIHAIVVPYKV